MESMATHNPSDAGMFSASLKGRANNPRRDKIGNHLAPLYHSHRPSVVLHHASRLPDPLSSVASSSTGHRLPDLRNFYEAIIRRQLRRHSAREISRLNTERHVRTETHRISWDIFVTTEKF